MANIDIINLNDNIDNDNNIDNDIPNHFSDEELIEIVDSSPFLLSLSTKGNRYELSCGLVLLCRTGLYRLCKRSKFRRKNNNNNGNDDDRDISKLLYKVVNFYAKSIDINIWTIENIFIASEELHTKSKLLSPKLQKILHKQPLLLHNNDINSIDFLLKKDKQQILHFDNKFLKQVAEYHDSLRRPEGTFEINESNEILEQLINLERDLCKKCNQRRSVYCGECKGLRMENAENLLPSRISLPFDILIVLHFAEHLKTCTGVHSSVLGFEGQVEFAYWPRGLYYDGESGKLIAELVASFDPSRDVILYPSSDAIDANEFPWQSKFNEYQENLVSENRLNDIINSDMKLSNHRWRLIILEASWQHGKTMAQQIIDYRIDQSLPPLKYISLSSLHGQYWKFHELGNSAVSTMEAIASAAKCAWDKIGSMSENDIKSKYEDLLFLFKLQKYRVLNRISMNNGNLPRTIFVDGGDNVWGYLTKNL